jgi:hypothetical protein
LGIKTAVYWAAVSLCALAKIGNAVLIAMVMVMQSVLIILDGVLRMMSLSSVVVPSSLYSFRAA